MNIDDIDRKILHLLSEDARITNADLAKKLNMVPSGILKRIRRLEKEGVIKRYETRVNDKIVGLTTTTFVKVYSDEKLGSTKVGEKIGLLHEVQEVHYMAGEFDYLLKVRIRNNFEYMDFIKKLGEIKGVRTCESIVVLNSLKETCAMNIKTDSGK